MTSDEAKLVRKGDRIEFTYRDQTYRATVESRSGLIIFFKPDDDSCPISWLDPDDLSAEAWRSAEKVTVYRAHSLEYLRGLPKECRPRLN